jgi:enoyl-CoA hydratase/carnithine racemase
LLNKIEKNQLLLQLMVMLLGCGCELAFACDIRIPSSNAKIGQTEVTIGIPSGWEGLKGS